MHADLREFLARFSAAVVMTLVPVKLIALLSMPLSLGHHPGESALEADPPAAHMT